MATYRVKTTHAGDYSGSSWSNAMGWSEFVTSITTASAAGDIYYIMEGTYTLTGDVSWSGRDGTNDDPITIIGVNDDTTNESPAYTDWSLGKLNGGTDDRPVLSCGTYTITSSTLNKIMNLTFKGTAATVFTLGQDGTLFNCKGENSSGTNDRNAIVLNSYATIAFCEACGLVGTGVVCRGIYSSSGSYIFFCYVHDCRSGIYLTTSGSQGVAVCCVAEDCSVYGIYGGSVNWRMINCTVNDCATGLYTTSSFRLAINNILEGCTTAGISCDSAANISIFLRNHGDDTRNTDMWVNVATTAPHGDPLVTTGDPKFDADGNLSLQSVSPCINTGFSMVLGT